MRENVCETVLMVSYLRVDSKWSGSCQSLQQSTECGAESQTLTPTKGKDSIRGLADKICAAGRRWEEDSGPFNKKGV